MNKSKAGPSIPEKPDEYFPNPSATGNFGILIRKEIL
jgi:hypothetical protein